MEIDKIRGIIEAILFSAGRIVNISELKLAVELNENDISDLIDDMNKEYQDVSRGIHILKINDGYQMTSKKEYHEFIYPIVDKRAKPKLSQAALETLSIIAYNPRITRAEIDSIRGVASDATLYKLLEYNLIEEAGRLEILGKPIAYKTSDEFLRLFGYNSLDDLPSLPKYKVDENKQIVLEDINNEGESKNE